MIRCVCAKGTGRLTNNVHIQVILSQHPVHSSPQTGRRGAPEEGQVPGVGGRLMYSINVSSVGIIISKGLMFQATRCLQFFHKQ